MTSTIQRPFDDEDVAFNASPPVAILNACNPGAWKRVGGIPLIARSLFNLDALGVKRAILLWETGHSPQCLEKWQGAIQMEFRQARNDLPEMPASVVDLADRFIYFDTGHLIDPRLLAALLSAPPSTICYMNALDRETSVIRAGLLTREDLSIWSAQGMVPLIRRAASILPADVDPFCPQIRGKATPYFMEVHTDGDAVEATRLLIGRQQKQLMDLPSEYLHPPFENALTFLLLKTPISPNEVTFMTAALGSLIACLFWHGYFVPGALLTFVVDILDGVDGKLARTKLQFSRLGEYEDLIDYFYENSWYVALGVGLSALTGGCLPMVFAAMLVLADTLDNVFYTLAGKWYGTSIDFFSRFDGIFRRIAGRRCIYGSLFVIGFSLGYPFATFVIASLWAVVTATIHGVRLHRYGQTIRRRPATEKDRIRKDFRSSLRFLKLVMGWLPLLLDSSSASSYCELPHSNPG